MTIKPSWMREVWCAEKASEMHRKRLGRYNHKRKNDIKAYIKKMICENLSKRFFSKM